MKKSLLTLLAVVACAPAPTTAPTPAPAQAPVAAASAGSGDRPLPYPVMESQGFKQGVEAGTRTRTGKPGAKYWQQWSEYDIDASYDPESGILTGRETITYSNRSPDSLRAVFLHLHDNLFDPASVKNRPVPTSGGVTIRSVRANGTTMAAIGGQSPRGYRIQGTIMQVPLADWLPPGGTLTLDIEWSLPVPPDGAPRGGRNEHAAFVSYWYPQMAVYDDVNGWQIDPYLANAEFYFGYGNYDVSITVPDGYLVGATGTLQNGARILAPAVQQRLARALTTDSVIEVVAAGAGDAATVAGGDGNVTWEFRAEQVRDFAWGTSNEYRWDATRANAGDIDGDGTDDWSAIHSFWYSGGTSGWSAGARYVNFSIEFLSDFLWPYPWPSMTAMEGPASCGGMEYPMMTCIGPRRDTLSMFGVTLHETGHMWFPMQVGSDEKRYAWQDEGFTQFNEANGADVFLKGEATDLAEARQNYLLLAASGQEVELMRHGDLYPNYTTFGIASYMKTAMVLDMLRSMLGEDVFMQGFRQYGRDWQWKHPTPFDFFNSMEAAAGRDLDWFWQSWFFETWQLDQAVASVTPAGDGTSIVIEDRGLVPMPAQVVVTYEGSRTDTLAVPVDTWLGGATSATLTAGAGVKKVEIDPGAMYADIDRSNNAWPRM